MPAAIDLGNGFGKLLGSTQVAELAPTASRVGIVQALPVDEVLGLLRQPGALP